MESVEKATAGAHAAIAYAAQNPISAQAVIAQLRNGETPDPATYDVLFGWLPARTDEAVVASIASMINGHLRRGSTESLEGVTSDVIQLGLMPHVGFKAAVDACSR
jgi:hypothetical protein